MTSNGGWIGFDLDGTLAHYEGWDGGKIGKPIENTVKLIKDFISKDYNVKIFTARVSQCEPGVHRAIEDWCLEHIGVCLPITCSKDYNMVRLYDDRCVQVETNTGRIIE